jgi:thymidylate synthase
METYSFADYASFTSLYQAILFDLVKGYWYKIAPRGLPVRENLNVMVAVDPQNCTIDFTQTGAPERQEVYDKYRKAELEWYLSGNTLASSAPSKFWNQLADKDGHITSNYGSMMLFEEIYPPHQDASPGSGHGYQTAIDRVVDTLVKDPDSRQAIVHYNQPDHCWPENKDFPCTMYSQFFIRGRHLHMTTCQRSCDIIKGFSYDVPWSCHFMEMVLNRLKERGLDVQLGLFTHVFGSLHLYEKDLELANKILQDADEGESDEH